MSFEGEAVRLTSHTWFLNASPSFTAVSDRSTGRALEIFCYTVLPTQAIVPAAPAVARDSVSSGSGGSTRNAVVMVTNMRPANTAHNILVHTSKQTDIYTAMDVVTYSNNGLPHHTHIFLPLTPTCTYLFSLYKFCYSGSRIVIYFFLVPYFMCLYFIRHFYILPYKLAKGTPIPFHHILAELNSLQPCMYSHTERDRYTIFQTHTKR